MLAVADLTGQERRALERLLGMGGGYVLDFSNRTFSQFIFGSTGREIYDDKYNHGGGSKANRLRAFWAEEPNHVVARLIGDLFDYAVERGISQEGASRLAACRRMEDRLRQSAPVPDIAVLVPETDEQDFEAISR